MDFERQSIDELLEVLVDLGFDYSRQKRSCSGLSDKDFILHYLHRILGDFRSGRHFLQFNLDSKNQKLPRSTMFDALHSTRRQEMVREVAKGMFKHFEKIFLEKLNVDYLADFSELVDFYIGAVDGHFIDHSCHTSSSNEPESTKNSDKLYAAGTIYLQDLRTGLLQSYSTVTKGHRKSHEMPVFRDSYDEFKKTHQQKKIIFVLDRGFVDHEWWSKKRTEGTYFISRTKTNFSLQKLGDIPFDKHNPINRGVKSYFLAGIGTSSTAQNFIDYEDPETGEEFQFYTSLSGIEPGLIAWLYFKRWTIEKSFDILKNELFERKAWATGDNALKIQSELICVAYNFIRLINEIAMSKMDEKDKALHTKKYQEWIQKREEKAKSQNKTINQLLKNVKRIARIPSQFIRCLKFKFYDKMPLRHLIPILIKRLTVLI